MIHVGILALELSSGSQDEASFAPKVLQESTVEGDRLAFFSPGESALTEHSQFILNSWLVPGKGQKVSL